MKTTPVRVGMKFVSPCCTTAENMKSSPMAFGKGGNPRLAQANKSHRRGRRINKLLIPRLTFRVRVPVRS